jgi:PDZ domain-containing protein
MEEIMNENSVPLPPPSRLSDARRLRVALPILTISWLVLVLVLAASAIRIQRWEIAPGEALQVADRLGFAPLQEGDAIPSRYPAENSVRLVTIYGGQLSILDTLMGWLDQNVQINTFKEQFGDRDPSTNRRLGFQAMTSAKQIAEYVAMKKIGLDAELTDGLVLIEQLLCDGAPETNAACDVLNVGDTVTALDGTPTPTLKVLASLMTSKKAGDIVELKVIPYDRNASEPDVSKAVKRTVTLMASSNDDDRAIIGFVPADTRTVKLPFDVTISTPDIGGPSAGLAFTLALLDELTKGNLMGTGGVVATGTMNEDETVGAIGGLRQKAVAAKDAGARLFLVPAGQSDTEVADARLAVGSALKIVTVATLDDALAALRGNGGAALELPTS